MYEWVKERCNFESMTLIHYCSTISRKVKAMNIVQPYKWGLELEYKRPVFTAGSDDRNESVAGYLVATQADPKWEGKKARNVEIKKTKMGNREETIFFTIRRDDSKNFFPQKWKTKLQVIFENKLLIPFSQIEHFLVLRKVAEIISS